MRMKSLLLTPVGTFYLYKVTVDDSNGETHVLKIVADDDDDAITMADFTMESVKNAPRPYTNYRVEDWED